jgi:hypothetical protein
MPSMKMIAWILVVSLAGNVALERYRANADAGAARR